MLKQSLDHLLQSDSLREKCGICGVFGKGFESSRLVYFGLWALQHRGQESSGISATDGKQLRTHKNEGLVAHVYQEKDLDYLKGHAAIGHNRYGTSGGSGPEHAQPVVSKHNLVTLAHNGNLPSVEKLKEFLVAKKVPIGGLNDSELMQRAIEYFLLQGRSIEFAVKSCYPLFTGAFCILLLTKNKMVAVRDSKGIRPLSLGKLNGGYVIASETCALDTIQARYVRDIKPGEMVVIDDKGLHATQLVKGEQKLDIFEFIYFARPDSVILGKNVNEVRRNLGIQLAKEFPLQADMVIPVPDSAIPAAVGYSQASGIPFQQGFIKNRYIHRTFIRPDQHLRERDIQIKLNPLPALLKGKDVVVIDDSVVRGSTSKKIVTMLRRIGVRKIYLLISCPPISFPDFYGIDTPTQQELIASEKTIPEIEKYIGADRVGYLSYNGLLRATGLPESVFATYAFTGEYPIDLLEKAKTISFVVPFIQKSYRTTQKANVVALGALNIDMIHKMQPTHDKKEVLLDTPILQAGGAAGNTAAALSRLGIVTSAIGRVGADSYGPMLTENLRSHGVDDAFVTTDPSTPSGRSYVFVDSEGKRTVYTKSGANSTLQKKDISYSYLKSAKHIHLSTFLDEEQVSLEKEVVSQLAGDVSFSFWADSHILHAPKPLIEKVLKYVQTIFIKESVLKEFTGYGGVEGARKLIEGNKEAVVAILESPYESEVVTPSDNFHIITKKTPLLDETGISCAYAAGFLFGQLNGYSPKQSAFSGHVMASFVGEDFGSRSHLPTIADFTRRFSLLKDEKNMLIIGGGGREHALAWKLSQSPRVKRMYVAPGNLGMVDVAHTVDIASDDIDAIKQFVKEKDIDITIIGPELPLAKGIVNELEKEGLIVFGPTKEAAELETSKSFAKEFMKKFTIPTPAYEIFDNMLKAKNYLKNVSYPVVIKADGLASGKGVLIAQSKKDAIAFVDDVMGHKKFGNAGSSVVIEEYLEGEEISLLSFTDGQTVIPMLPAQDHKRIFDKDNGPNTGGMGTYAPVPMVSSFMVQDIVNKILLPTIKGMKKIGRPYKGILFAGIMLTKKGPKVLEFNCRFGDPEAQVILPLLKNDLLPVIEAIIDDRLEETRLEWSEDSAMCVVLTAGGYPDSPEKNKIIEGLSTLTNENNSYVFHSGTKAKVITSGGRVLGVFAKGKTLKKAIENSYQTVSKLSFENMHYRKDIGAKGMKFLKKKNNMNYDESIQKKIAVLISNAGTGSNLQSIIDAITARELNAQISVVVSDSDDAKGLERAKKSNVPTYVVKSGESIDDVLTTKFAVDYIVMAGWKKIVPDSLIQAFPNKIINIHPGLIPEIIKTPDGKDGQWNKGKFTSKAIKNVLQTDSQYAGSSIHFLSQEFDFGKVLARNFEKVKKNDTEETLYVRLKKKENKMIVEALKQLAN